MNGNSGPNLCMSDKLGKRELKQLLLIITIAN